MKKFQAVPLATAVTLLAFAAAGCGSGENAAAGDSASNRQLQAALKWARCMRAHGVDVPDPTVSANGLEIQVGTQGPGKSRVPRASMVGARVCDHFLRQGSSGRRPSAAEQK